MSDEYTGEDRRKKELLTEHRLSVIETHIPQIHDRIQEIKDDLKSEGEQTRTTITGCVSALTVEIVEVKKRVSVIEMFKIKVVNRVKGAAWVISSLGVSTIIGIVYKIFHHGKDLPK